MRAAGRIGSEDVIALCIVALGVAVAWQGSAYGPGTLTNMGPGFFPLWLGVTLAGLGGVLAVGRIAKRAGGDDPGQAVPWRAILAVSAGLLAWMALVRPLGLVPATVALVVLSSLAERRFRPVAILVSAVVLPAVAAIVFILGLKMPLSIVTF